VKSEAEFTAERASFTARHQADAAGGGVFDHSKSVGELKGSSTPVSGRLTVRRSQTMSHDLGVPADVPSAQHAESDPNRGRSQRWTHCGSITSRFSTRQAPMITDELINPQDLHDPRESTFKRFSSSGNGQMCYGTDEVLKFQDPRGPKLRRSSSFNKTVGRKTGDFSVPESSDEPHGPGAKRSGSAPPRTKLRSPMKMVPRNDGMSFDTASTTDVTGITGQIEEYIHNRRAAMANALDSTGRPFGIGDRIDPKMWGSLIEKYVYGGHYEYIVGDLGTKQQRDAAKEALDRDLMAALHVRTRSPEASPRPAMRAAFTDRSARMREGMHTHTIFDYKDCEPADNTTVYHASTSCGRNRHFEYPAGAPSHKFHHNKLSTAHTEQPDAHVQSTDSPRRPRGSNSEGMSRAIGKHDDCLYTRPEVHSEEYHMVSYMCRKKREGLGAAEDAAGGYNRNVGGTQITRLGRANSPRSEVDLTRNDMRMIMTPRDDDPSAPLQISPARKSVGTCRVPSEHCEKNAAHYNQEVLRYEMVAGQDQPNMRTLPYDLSPQISPRLKRNPLNHDGWEEPRPKSLSRPSPIKAPHDNVALVTNQIEMAQQASDERAQRLAIDRGFAASCSQVGESRSRLAESMAGLQRNHHMVSDSVVTSLSWDS